MSFEYVSPLVSHIPGAVAVDQEDLGGRSGVSWHYGSPLVEQGFLQEVAGVVDRSYYRYIQVSGADRLTWLNTLFSQKVDQADPGEVYEALNLDGQGHVLHHMTYFILEDSVIIEVSPLGYESLLKYLNMMVFWSDIQLTEIKLAALSILGPNSAQVLEAAGLPRPEVGHGALLADAASPEVTASSEDGSSSEVAFVRHLNWPNQSRYDVVVTPERLTATFDRLVAAGAKPVGLMGWEAERVVSLHPEAGLDVDEKLIPNEARAWIGSAEDAAALHLDKGCYRGQETVARIHFVGRPPRAVVMLQIDGSASELPQPGDVITSGKRTVGRVGTVVHHNDFGPIALALVKRSAQQKDDLTVGECAVSVDPTTMDLDDSLPAGRVAMNKLRSQ